MFVVTLLFYLVSSGYGKPYEPPSNTLSCPPNQQCTYISNCPNVLLLMDRNELPVHRFRQAICGYDEARPKICCSTPVVEQQGTSNSFPRQDTALYSSTRSNVDCGRSLIRSSSPTLGTYPFLARIGFIHTGTGDIKYPCSGVIINERSILTTATCALATSPRYKLYSVLVGDYDIDTDPDCNSMFCGCNARSYNVSYVVKHPDFRVENYRDNIAILRLKRPINYTVTAQPVCSIPEDRYVPTGSSTILAGWGKLSGQKEKSSEQQWVPMKLLPKEDCLSYTRQGLSVDLCASGEEEPCSGYSGSPLLYKYGDTHFLTGILSYGAQCEKHSRLPSVFVNVQRYTRWIQENA